MYVRTIQVKSSSGTLHEYVRLVEAYREEGRVRQRVLLNLGPKELLARVLPQLQRLLQESGDAGGVQARGADPSSDPDLQPLEASTWGPVLVARQLFQELGLFAVLDRHLGSKPERLVTDRAFVLIANRLIQPASEHGLAGWLESDFVCDRQGQRFRPAWRTQNRVKVEFGQLQTWYRTLDRLVAVQGAIELALYHRLRDLFSLKPDLVFYDVTSTYFEGQGPSTLALRGYSRDEKPRNPQVVVGVVMVNGWPIAHHVFPGNTVDNKTVPGLLADLRSRFGFGRIVLVGDRGMVSTTNLDCLRARQPGSATEAEPDGYLFGLRRRHNPTVQRYLARLRPDAWLECPVGITAAEKQHPPRTRVQEVPHDDEGLRVFVIDSEERKAYEQALRERDMQKTQQELEALQRRVAAGKLTDPALVGAAAQRTMSRHRGHRCFSWTYQDGVFAFGLDPQKVAEEEALEGNYLVETTEKDLTPQEAVQSYKELSEVERAFRHIKNLQGLRPVFHQTEPRVRAHIFVTALAFLLERLLEKKLKAAGVGLSTTEALQALQTVRHVAFQHGNHQRTGVTPGSPRARQVLKALGIQDCHPPTPAKR